MELIYLGINALQTKVQSLINICFYFKWLIVFRMSKHGISSICMYCFCIIKFQISLIHRCNNFQRHLCIIINKYSLYCVYYIVIYCKYSDASQTICRTLKRGYICVFMDNMQLILVINHFCIHNYTSFMQWLIPYTCNPRTRVVCGS